MGGSWCAGSSPTNECNRLKEQFDELMFLEMHLTISSTDMAHEATGQPGCVGLE